MQDYVNFIIRLLLCFIPISAFILIFTPITIYLVYFFFFNFNPVIINNILVINKSSFEFIEACIVPYAYYFLWILCLLTKDIILKTRIKVIIYGFLLIFLMNILRISLLIYLSINYGEYWFNLVHMFFWKFLSGVYVALVWILLVKIYKIKSIPIYDDLKDLYKKIKFDH